MTSSVFAPNTCIAHQNVAAEIPETDPWGTRYRVVTMDDGRVRIVSAGANKWFKKSRDTDTDDIHSDMSVSPTEPFRVRKTGSGSSPWP